MSVLVAGIITLGACSGSDRASDDVVDTPSPATAHDVSPAPHTATTVPPRSTTTLTTDRPRTSRPMPDFSFDESVPPPPIVNTGTDYVAILKSFDRYNTWLGAHRPDPALAPVTVAAGSQLLSRYVLDVTLLRDRHERIIEKLGRPSEYTILSATPTAVSARVVQHITLHQLVDASGRVTREQHFAAPTTYLEVAVLDHGRWYLAELRPQGPAEVHL